MLERPPIDRRDLTQGQRAIIAAMANLHNLCNYGDASVLARALKVPQQRVSEALIIVTHAPNLAEQVKRSLTPFHTFYGDREWTMQRIAAALDVNQTTITRDLANLCTTHKSKHSKTDSNPKGAGRPKNSTAAKKSGGGSRRRQPKTDTTNFTAR